MEDTLMKKLITLAAILSLTACGADSKDDAIGQVGGVSVNETSSNNDTGSNSQAVSMGSVISGSLGPSDEFDFYKVTIASGETVTIRLSGDNNTDLDIALLTSNYSTVAFSEEYGSTETFTYTAPAAGDFYVKVEYFDGSSASYQLSITSDGSSDTSGGSGNTLEAQFCVESIGNGTSYYQVASGASTPTNNLQEGTCPSAGYVSKCNVVMSGTVLNTYFSQGYVDVVGGHGQVEAQVCDAFATQGATSSYTLY
jgi:hypothetical protein